MYLEEMNLSTRLECETVIFEIELCQGDSANTIIVFTSTAEWPEPLSNSFWKTLLGSRTPAQRQGTEVSKLHQFISSVTYWV